MDIVEKFCGFLAPDWGEFLDFIHLKGKIFHGGTVRRGPTRGGSGRAPAGFFGLRTKGFSWDAGRRESRHQEWDSSFVPIRAGGRLAGLYAEPTAAGAADSGGQLQALLIRVVR